MKGSEEEEEETEEEKMARLMQEAKMKSRQARLEKERESGRF